MMDADTMILIDFFHIFLARIFQILVFISQKGEVCGHSLQDQQRRMHDTGG